MNKLLCAIAFLFTALPVFAQSDRNGNPVFNSVITKEETVQDYVLVSNYYTLSNNVDNKLSSVYISAQPRLADNIKAAQRLPSDFFSVKKSKSMQQLILFQTYPDKVFLVMNPSTGEARRFPCPLKGDITENRADEIIKNGYDSTATISDGALTVNHKKLAIISKEAITKAVVDLIEREHLSAGEPSAVKVPSKDDLKEFVLRESKEGGKMDFFTEIKGHEYDGVEVKPGTLTTRLGIALYKWGKANYELGVNTVDDALQYWKAIKNREANQREASYIKLGFDRGLEK